MNGLPIYLTSESLYLGDLPVTEWVKAGSVSLVNVDYVDWELTFTLRVIPCGAAVAADLAVTTDSRAAGEGRLSLSELEPVAPLPTTPGSIIRYSDIKGIAYYLTSKGWRYLDKKGRTGPSHVMADSLQVIVFDAGADL